MNRFVVDGLIGLIIAVIYLVVCSYINISPVSMAFFIGLATMIIGAIAYFVLTKETLAKRISKIIVIAGAISTFAIFAMVFVMLSHM